MMNQMIFLLLNLFDHPRPNRLLVIRSSQFIRIEKKYTFDVAKCDKIFDELHKGGYIKIAYTLPSTDEIKHRAYYK